MLALIDQRQLYGHGSGYVDVHLLAATMLTRDARRWARDKRLGALPVQLGPARGDAQES